jgi:hypothetical protein
MHSNRATDRAQKQNNKTNIKRKSKLLHNGLSLLTAGAALCGVTPNTLTPYIVNWLILEYRGQLTSREVGETTHHGVLTLEFEVSRLLDLDVSFLWDRVSVPKPQEDGTVPKPDDFRLILTLGLDF